jgi:hypothetical protein
MLREYTLLFPLLMADSLDPFKNALKRLLDNSSASDTKNSSNHKPLTGSQIKELAKLATSSDINKVTG